MGARKLKGKLKGLRYVVSNLRIFSPKLGPSISKTSGLVSFLPLQIPSIIQKKENLTITYRDIRGHSFSTYASKGGGGDQANAYSYKNIEAKQYR